MYALLDTFDTFPRTSCTCSSIVKSKKKYPNVLVSSNIIIVIIDSNINTPSRLVKNGLNI